jgi:hypothetical protein
MGPDVELNLLEDGERARLVTSGDRNDFYVTDFGRVISVIRSCGKERILKQATHDRDGYKYVCLTFNGKNKTRTTHTLVLEAFVGPRPVEPSGKPYHLCHNDGDESNDAPENLRWDTCKNNMGDKAKHGTTGRKLNKAQVTEIRSRFATGRISAESLAKDYPVSVGAIGGVISNRTYYYASYIPPA